MAKKIGLELVIGLVDEASSGLSKIADGLKGLAVVGGAAAAAAIVAVGKAAWDAGLQYDEAIDTIITKTGATGATLDGLGADFKAVFTSIPTDAATAAGALAELNQKTGLTGPTLQGATEQVIEMSRLLGGDAAANAAAFGETFNKWGIPAADAGAALDGLFVAAQKTGVGADVLLDQVTRFAAPLQQFGFGFTEATALVANFEAAGVNTQQAMSGLTRALGTFAREGEDPRTALEGLVAQIQTAGTDAEATALAVEAFGAKGGPELAGAIRAGRLSVAELTAAMGDADGAIMQTADATNDFPEKLQVLKNKVATLLMPLGAAMMDGVTAAVDALGPAVDQIFGWFESITAAGTPIAALWATLQATAETVWPQIQAVIEQAWETIQGIIGGAISVIGPLVQEHGAGVAGTLGETWTKITEIIGLAWQIISEIIGAAAQNVRNFLSAHSTEIQAVLGGAWEIIKGIFSTALEIIKGILQTALALIRGDWEGAWTALQTTVGNVWTNIQGVVAGAVTIIETVLGGAWGRIRDGAVTAWEGIKTAIVNAFDGAVQGIKDILNKIIDAMNGAIRSFNKLPGPDIGEIARLATGAHSFAGGLAVVGEAGPELVHLPVGSRVYSAGETQHLGGGNTYNFAFAAPANAYDEQRIEAAVVRGMLRAGVRADVLRRTR